jgi:hypothetical protein
MALVVTAPSVKVTVVTPDGGRATRILARGAAVPEGVPVPLLTVLLTQGRIAEDVDAIVAEDPNGEPVEIMGVPIAPGENVADAKVIPGVGDEVHVPAGDPVESWTHEQIDAWAARQSPPILLDSTSTKAEKIAALAVIASDNT